MQWVKVDPSDFRGNPPFPRSGHTAVNVSKSKAIVFGGFADRKFLDDVSVFDIENKLWFTPECTGNGSDGQVGPNPRAFHVAVAIDCHMFIFGGRSGSKRLGDFWMLDTDIWQWSELTSYGDLPSPREFAAASAIGNRKIVMYGGWDGKKWLSDVYILDTISLEWTELSISGSVPPPRCGHTATMVEKRLLIFGGRGGGGPIMGDLWALKGLIDEENDAPGWTQLKLPGQPPSPRCGHTVTSSGHHLLLFGGHGTGGWLSRYDIYHNDCIILDRVSVQWKRLPISNEPPPARAYHSMSCIGARFLLFGGFDGKSTFGDFWWLVPEDDPLATRLLPTPKGLPESKSETRESDSRQSTIKENMTENSPLVDLKKRQGISVSSSKVEVNLVGFPWGGIEVQALRDHWEKCTATSIQLRELGPLLRDYQRLIIQHHLGRLVQDFSSATYNASPGELHLFFHVKSASQLRMDDVPKLLDEYKQLLKSKA